MPITKVFELLNLPPNPVFLAPLAGVSDHPFRRVCTREGADLTYVEMISATALLYASQRTIDMLKRHSSEARLGVQLTGPSPDQVGRAVAIMEQLERFDTYDINMGCPVKKVVKTGCGSAILRDPERVLATVRAAVASSSKPVSAKIRLGWDQQSKNGIEVAQAAAAGGAAWITVHGRTRADDYGVPVDLEGIRQIKAAVSIPVIGNGNLFAASDLTRMQALTGVDGFMISRGALGNPWLFRDIKRGVAPLSIDDWEDLVLEHLAAQRDEYADHPGAAVCMRKHLLWYAKGWNGVRSFREEVNQAGTLAAAKTLVQDFAAKLREQGQTFRAPLVQVDSAERFAWDPKYDMDRRLDRGVGDEGLQTLPETISLES